MMQNLSLGFQEEVTYRLRSLYNRSGYSQYRMSKFEEYDLYARNKDFLISDSVITFMDVGGRLMALKPDVTLSIVKNTRDEGCGVQKLYYNENVYRVTPGAHGFREIMQLGLECIGSIDDYCLWEVLNLAAESLRAVSAESILDVSHLDLLSNLLDGVGIPPERKDDALRLVAEKNEHDLAALCRKCNVSAERIEILRRAVACSGDPEVILPELKAILTGITDTAPVDQLTAIMSALPDDIRGMIRFDFSAVDDIHYYNGIVFKGYIHGLPRRVLSGGQYDRLMGKMGRRSGAVGFAVYMDALERLDRSGREYDADDLLLYGEDTNLAALSRCVQELKQSGRSVLVQRTVPEQIRVRRILKLTGGEVREV